MESALGRKEQKNRHRKVTGDVEARICAIACSTPPEGASRWTMQAIAEELIRLEVVDYITDSTVWTDHMIFDIHPEHPPFLLRILHQPGGCTILLQATV